MTAAADRVTPRELSAWRRYIGRSEVHREVLDVGCLRRFAVAVGSTTDVDRRSPPLAHWAFFADALPAEHLSGDGHRVRGEGILPPITLPRRMFAASSVHFREPLNVGREAELTLTLIDVRHRVGGSGDLVFIDVDRRLRQDGRERVVERQTIAYRGAGAPMASIEDSRRETLPGEELWTPDTVELFRFSAATFNAHRIHYDQHYATRTEGYPDLVVHGPLIAAKLFSFARNRLAGDIHHFSFRARAPLFVNQQAILTAIGDTNEVACLRRDGQIVMSAAATDREVIDDAG